jgi:hypothetical protein
MATVSSGLWFESWYSFGARACSSPASRKSGCAWMLSGLATLSTLRRNGRPDACKFEYCTTLSGSTMITWSWMNDRSVAFASSGTSTAQGVESWVPIHSSAYGVLASTGAPQLREYRAATADREPGMPQS